MTGNFFEADPEMITPISAEQFSDSFLSEAKPAVVRSESEPAEESEPTTVEEEPGTPIIPEQLEDVELPELRKWTKEERQEMTDNLEMMLNFRSIGQAELLAWISGESSEKYELTEEQMQRLAKVYAPYMRKFGAKIPDWFWLILAEGIITTPLIRQAIKDRQTNRANQKLAASAVVKTAIASAATTSTTERKNYSIDELGYYIKDAKSNAYLKKAKRTTKASFADIERILQDNELELVQSVFPELQDKNLNDFEG